MRMPRSTGGGAHAVFVLAQANAFVRIQVHVHSKRIGHPGPWAGLGRQSAAS